MKQLAEASAWAVFFSKPRTRARKEEVSSRFRMQRLTDFYYAWGAGAADFNHDGVTDVVAGPHIFFGPDYSSRREIYLQIATNPSDEYTRDCWMQFVDDFTADGWADVITASFSGNPGVWLYVNPKGESRRWDKHLVVPAFTPAALLGIALPLYLVTMASQNVPGAAVLASYGYRPPWRASLAVTGVGFAVLVCGLRLRWFARVRAGFLASLMATLAGVGLDIPPILDVLDDGRQDPEVPLPEKHPVEHVGPGTVSQIVRYFHAASLKGEESRQVIYLMGPVGSGKSSLIEKLHRGLEESDPFYAIEGCPMFEEPLHLIPRHLRKEFEKMLAGEQTAQQALDNAVERGNAAIQEAIGN